VEEYAGKLIIVLSSPEGMHSTRFHTCSPSQVSVIFL